MLTRSAYGKKNRVHAHHSTDGGAKQSFKQECDINQIMAKYQKTGLVTHFNEHKANYGFAPALDYREALEKIRTADEMFSELPSSIRKKFDNKPERFLAFTENPDNRSQMALMGLLKPETTDPESPPSQPSDSASAPLPPAPKTDPKRTPTPE